MQNLVNFDNFTGLDLLTGSPLLPSKPSLPLSPCGIMRDISALQLQILGTRRKVKSYAIPSHQVLPFDPKRKRKDVI